MEKRPQNFQEQKRQETALEKVRSKTTKKLLGLAAGLSLALSTKATNLETHTEIKNPESKTEYAESGDEKMPVEGLTSQYEESFEKFVEIDFTNYFDTDKADIEQESVMEIEKKFEDFLESVNSETIENVLKSDFIIYSSCDERPSSAFESNLDLNLARSKNVSSVLGEVLKNFDFSKSGITQDQIQEIKNKTFSFDYPEFQNAEPGVVPLEKEKEIFGDSTESMSKEDLYALVRLTRFELRIPVSRMEEKKTEQISAVENSQEKFESITKLLSQEKTNVILFDRSGSMHDDIDALVEVLQNFNDVQVGSFSNHFDGIADVKNKNDVEKVMSGGASTRERVLHSLQEFLNSYGKNNALENLNVIVVSDEELQDISLVQIQSIKKDLEANGVGVTFVLREDGETQVTIQDIESSLVESSKYQKEVEDIQKNIEYAEGKYQQTSSKEAKGMWEKTIQQHKNRLQQIQVKAFNLPIKQIHSS